LSNFSFLKNINFMVAKVLTRNSVNSEKSLKKSLMIKNQELNFELIFVING